MTNFDTKDYYFQKAKSKGFNARSVFKLEEIDKDIKVIKPNSHVLDLGCSPGSWLQYVDTKLSSKGAALGIDLTPVKTIFKNKVRCIAGDIFTFDPETISTIMLDLTNDFNGFDVILSDMAPKTCGIKHLDQMRSFELAQKVYELSLTLLKQNGSLIIKIFNGSEVESLVKEMKTTFKEVKHKRPKSIRAQSKEFYLVGLNKK